MMNSLRAVVSSSSAAAAARRAAQQHQRRYLSAEGTVAVEKLRSVLERYREAK